MDADNLEAIVLAKITNDSTLADIAAAATALKQIAESKGALAELKTHRSFKLERLKSLSALLVPLASLIALPVSIVVGGLQIRAAQQQAAATVEATAAQAQAAATIAHQQAEDGQWRDFLNSLSKESSAISDPTLAPRLRSFASSERYGRTARDIGARLLGHVTSKASFTDLVDYVFPTVDGNNLETVVGVGRTLKKTRSSIESLCNAAYRESTRFSECGASLTDDDFSKKLKSLKGVRDITAELLRQRQAVRDLAEENILLSRKLEDALRRRLAPGSENSRDLLDLSSIVLAEINLSDLNFSSTKISQTLFEYVDLANANLSGSVSDSGTEFRLSNWWDAKSIDSSLLIELIRYSNPLYSSNVRLQDIPRSAGATQNEYTKKVKHLCSVARAECPAVIPYGPTSEAS